MGARRCRSSRDLLHPKSASSQRTHGCHDFWDGRTAPGGVAIAPHAAAAARRLPLLHCHPLCLVVPRFAERAVCTARGAACDRRTSLAADGLLAAALLSTLQQAHPPPAQAPCAAAAALGASHAADCAALVTLALATGPVSRWVAREGWLSSDVPHCGWHGVACDAAGRVTAVRLDLNQLTGTLPGPALGALTQLRTLTLRHNGLRGAVPAELGTLRRLRRLCVPPARAARASGPACSARCALRWTDVLHVLRLLARRRRAQLPQRQPAQRRAARRAGRRRGVARAGAERHRRRRRAACCAGNAATPAHTVRLHRCRARSRRALTPRLPTARCA